jgi:hypothetical protein
VPQQLLLVEVVVQESQIQEMNTLQVRVVVAELLTHQSKLLPLHQLFPYQLALVGLVQLPRQMMQVIEMVEVVIWASELALPLLAAVAAEVIATQVPADQQLQLAAVVVEIEVHHRVRRLVQVVESFPRDTTAHRVAGVGEDWVEVHAELQQQVVVTEFREMGLSIQSPISSTDILEVISSTQLGALTLITAPQIMAGVDRSLMAAER